MMYIGIRSVRLLCNRVDDTSCWSQ